MSTVQKVHGTVNNKHDRGLGVILIEVIP